MKQQIQHLFLKKRSCQRKAKYMQDAHILTLRKIAGNIIRDSLSPKLIVLEEEQVLLFESQSVCHTGEHTKNVRSKAWNASS